LGGKNLHLPNLLYSFTAETISKTPISQKNTQQNLALLKPHFNLQGGYYDYTIDLRRRAD
jgi:hypothetical protein